MSSGPIYRGSRRGYGSVKNELLKYFKKTDIPDPVDIFVDRIAALIDQGAIKPGDRLPSGRVIEKQMELPRGVINKAMQRLEAYGIIRTAPQSGTYIADHSRDVLLGLITNLQRSDSSDYEYLVDVRCLLEEYAVRLVAADPSEQAIRSLEVAYGVAAGKIEEGHMGFDEDIVFHLKVVELSGNPVLRSIVTLLAVDSLEILSGIEHTTGAAKVSARLKAGLAEHAVILDAIKARDPDRAAAAVHAHFKKAKEFRKGL